jgi:enoyl-CoA hydratase
MDTVNWWIDGPVAWIEVNRPDKLNALGRATLLRLRYHVQDAIRNAETRVLVLTGSGDRAFIAGADIAEMFSLEVDGIRGMMELGKEVADLLESSPKPVIAAVNGYALGGGCELSLACDLVVAAENAQFGLPEVDLGIIPGWGGSQRLERRVGYGRARDMILTSRRVPAAEALAWGLCDRVFPQATLREEVAKLALHIGAKDPAALAVAKKAMRNAAELPLADGLRSETDLFTTLLDRPERVEAMERFVNKRR